MASAHRRMHRVEHTLLIERWYEMATMTKLNALTADIEHHDKEVTALRAALAERLRDVADAATAHANRLADIGYSIHFWTDSLGSVSSALSAAQETREQLNTATEVLRRLRRINEFPEADFTALEVAGVAR